MTLRSILFMFCFSAKAAAQEHRRPKWGISGRVGHEVPQRLRSLVELCWAADPDMRPEFDEIVVELTECLTSLPIPSSPSPTEKKDKAEKETVGHQNEGCGCTIA